MTLKVTATPEYFVNGRQMPSFGEQQLMTLIGEELQKAYKAPEVVERFKEVVLLPGDKPMSPADYTKFIGDFAATWAEVSKSAGISLELG